MPLLSPIEFDETFVFFVWMIARSRDLFRIDIRDKMVAGEIVTEGKLQRLRYFERWCKKRDRTRLYAVPKIDIRGKNSGDTREKKKEKEFERSSSRTVLRRSSSQRIIDETIERDRVRIERDRWNETGVGNYANPWRRKGTGTKGSRAESEKLASRFQRDTKYTRSKERERGRGECKGATSGREEKGEEEGKKLAEEDSSKVFGEVFGETERVGRKGEDAANGTKKQSEEARGANEE